MRNLELVRHAARRTRAIGSVRQVCVDVVQSVAYVLDDAAVRCVSLRDDVCVDACVDVREALRGRVRAFAFNSALGAACALTAAGDVVTVRPPGDGADVSAVETVGCVDGGVAAAAWSPDEELLLIVTGAGRVLTMGPSFDPMWEAPVWDETFGEQAPVTVGWGSKETQFHGKEGKAAAKGPVADMNGEDQERQQEIEDEVSVSWRGDGALVAISSLRPSGGRAIRIFNREGALQATSEEVTGLKALIAWRPSGNLLASVQHQPRKHQVVFFEKNGLRHGEFVLPFAPDAVGTVHQLVWSPNSDALAVWYEAPEGDQLLLYTVGNYHWYVKQTLLLGPFPSGMLRTAAWHGDAPFRLLLAAGRGEKEGIRLLDLEWRWTVSRGPISDNRAVVAVVDGAEVLLTDFAEKVIPPPMCAQKLPLPNAAAHLAFAPSGDLCVVLNDGRLALFEGKNYTLRCICRVCGDWGDLDDTASNSALLHWLWLNAHSLLCIRAMEDSYCEVLQINLTNAAVATDGEECVVQAVRLDVPLDGEVISLTSIGDGLSGQALVQTAAGDLILIRDLSSPGEVAEAEPLGAVPERFGQMHAMVPNGACGDRSPLIVGVGEYSGRLYVDGRRVMAGVTSLLPLPPDALLVTTNAHQLLWLPLDPDAISLGSEALLQRAVGRRVERGSRLVAAAPSAGARVVLQLPRGNLETVTPRALVLREAAVALDAQCYAEAFRLFRKQRIDLNLLVDHDPCRFLLDAEALVRAVAAQPHWLQLLVAEARDEDTTLAAYADVYRERRMRTPPAPWGDTAEGKRAAVCTRLREAMQVVEAELEAEGVGGGVGLAAAQLSALAATGALEAALALARRAEAAGAGGGGGGLPLEASLAQLLALASPHALFDAALALRDWELAARVAQRAGRDPKEYLPFLNELRREPEPFRSFRVDAHLGRWRCALAHLAQCDAPQHFERFLQLTQERGLYAHALSLLDPESDKYRAVATAYGWCLQKERRLEEAAVILRRAQRPKEAMEAARQAGNWTQVLELLLELQLPASEWRTVVQSLCTVLVQQRRFSEAAQALALSQMILAQQTWSSSASSVTEEEEKAAVENAEEEVHLLCRGRLWAEAGLAACRAGRADLLESKVNAGALEHCERLTEELASLAASFDTHLQRLRTVREEKALRFQQERDEHCPEGDLFSDTSSSSGGSQSSRSSNRSGRSSSSGRSRRKQERKLLSLKEGSPWEPLALLRAMHQEASALLNMRREVRALCLALVGARQDAPAARLQQQLEDALGMLEQNMAEVWPPALTTPMAGGGDQERFGPEATADSIVSGTYKVCALVENCELLEPQYRIPPQSQDLVLWKLSILNSP